MFLKWGTEKIFMTSEILTTFENSIPLKPYCTDELSLGLKIRPAETAIKKRYIQPNKPTDLRWLVYDVDRSTAHYDWQDLHAPAPNFTVMNPDNGHAHLYYGLEVPVFMQMGAKQNPIRYVSSVDVALTQKLEADPAYAKLIAKNPLHGSWSLNIWNDRSYELAELADWLDLSAMTDRRVRLPEIGLGRNCNLFDATRFFAYREIRKPVENLLFPELYSLESFILRCQCYAKLHNTFSVPLPVRECETIGKSVGKWVYQHMSPEGFLEWCHKRARYGNQKSIEVRSAKADLKAEQVKAYKLDNPTASMRTIAKKLGLFGCFLDLSRDCKTAWQIPVLFLTAVWGWGFVCRNFSS